MALLNTVHAFRDVDQVEVVRTIESSFDEYDCFVSPQLNRWVNVYDKQCHALMDMQRVDLLATTICSECSCRGVVFAVIGSDYFCYWVYDAQGATVAFSCPESDRGNLTTAERLGLLGDPGAIAALADDSSITGETVQQILESGDKMNLQLILYKLAPLLQIENSLFSYPEFSEDAHILADDIFGWHDFRHLQRGSPESVLMP